MSRCYDEMSRKEIVELLETAEALAADRLKLLRRFRDTWEFELAHEKEYPSKGGWIENREKVKVLMSEVAKELGDG